MLERISLFMLGGGGYLAVELAWRGTSHWTMFLAGGACLCLLQRLAARKIALPAATGIGAAGASVVGGPVQLGARQQRIRPGG